MHGIKGKTVRELQIKQRRSNTGIPTTSRLGFKAMQYYELHDVSSNKGLFKYYEHCHPKNI